MKVNDFIRYARRKDRPVEMLYPLDKLELIPGDKPKNAAMKDKRSFFWNNCWRIYPIAVDLHHVYIVCPHCGEIHLHGRTVDGYEGHRVSHCKQHGNNGYWILKAVK